MFSVAPTPVAASGPLFVIFNCTLNPPLRNGSRLSESEAARSTLLAKSGSVRRESRETAIVRSIRVVIREDGWDCLGQPLPGGRAASGLRRAAGRSRGFPARRLPLAARPLGYLHP